ncbi:MAG: S-layer homology domain-containing protein [Candidatus Cohnella colombiensis]|uniref:S-layer homology domain-containing protein n=1 Tax=Candidatus Cohnella colombiensis TaxID=3121368 RepID=A0AA95EUA6_9BACL|nr:MAG: S-layer homology domain-containing protein [Cohnella sp.]
MFMKKATAKVATVLMVFALLFSAFGGMASATPSPTLTSITLNTGNTSLPVGQTLQLVVTAHYSDDSTVDVTSQSDFSSNYTNWVSVSSDGLITSVSDLTYGFQPVISVLYGEQSAQVEVTPTMALPVAPLIYTFGQGTNTGSTSFTYTKRNPSDRVYYSFSSNPTLPQVVGVPIDQVESTQQYNSGTDIGGVRVEDYINIYYVNSTGNITDVQHHLIISNEVKGSQLPTLLSITLNTSNTSLPVGQTLQLVVTAHYSNDSTADVTSKSLFSSNYTNWVSVSSGGLITSVSDLTYGFQPVISVLYGEHSAQVEVTPTMALPVAPLIYTFGQGTNTGSTSFTYTKRNPSDRVYYSSSSNPTLPQVVGVPIDQVESTQQYNSGTDIGGVRVEDYINIYYVDSTGNIIDVQHHLIISNEVKGSQLPTLLSITLNTVNTSLPVGLKLQLVVTAHYSNDSTADVTSKSLFSSNYTNWVSVTPRGLIKSISDAAFFQPVISVIYGEHNAQVEVTPTMALDIQVSSIDFTPSTSISIVEGQSSNLPSLVKAYYDDGNTVVDVTDDTTWSIGDVNGNPLSQQPYASIDTVHGKVNGLVAGGGITLVATYQGYTHYTPIVVTPARIGIHLSTYNKAMTVGQSFDVTASAQMSDSTTIPFTDDQIVTWSSDNTSVATVANGHVIAVGVGTAFIWATQGEDQDYLEVTVSAAPNSNYYNPVIQPPTTPVDPVGPTVMHLVINNNILNIETLKEIYAKRNANTTQHNFTDVPANSWSVDVIDQAFKMGIIEGKDAEHFDPNGKVTRAEFATMIMKAFGITPTVGQSFPDARDHWATQAIQTLVEKGVLKGYSDGNFRPDKEISREEMAAVLARLIEYVKPESDEFSDTGSSWAVEEINALANAGVISGKGNGQFDPRGNATRAEAVAMIVRLLENLIGNKSTQA